MSEQGVYVLLLLLLLGGVGQPAAALQAGRSGLGTGVLLGGSWTTQRVVLLLLVVTLTSKLQRFNVRATTSSSSSSITALLLLGLDDASRRSMAKRIVCCVPSLMLVAISIPTWQESAAGFVVGMRLRVEPGACDSMVILAQG
jgi:hypothetical protein